MKYINITVNYTDPTIDKIIKMIKAEIRKLTIEFQCFHALNQPAAHILIVRNVRQ